MPYIKQENRQEVDWNGASDAGELNYAITTLCLEYLIARTPRYQDFNDVIGALEGAKLELYRRLVVPYEDKKIQENGDVYV